MAFTPLSARSVRLIVVLSITFSSYVTSMSSFMSYHSSILSRYRSLILIFGRLLAYYALLYNTIGDNRNTLNL